jgi:hypothetical protein
VPILLRRVIYQSCYNLRNLQLIRVTPVANRISGRNAIYFFSNQIQSLRTLQSDQSNNGSNIRHRCWAIGSALQLSPVARWQISSARWTGGSFTSLGCTVTAIFRVALMFVQIQ